MQRALDRLRPVTGHRQPVTETIHRHAATLARGIRVLVLPDRAHDRHDRGRRDAREGGVAGAAEVLLARPQVHRARGGAAAVADSIAVDRPKVAPARLRRRSLVSRVGPDRAVPAAAIAILVLATAISSAPGLAGSGPVGGTNGAGSEARLTAGGVDGAIGGPGGTIGGPDGTIGDSIGEGLGMIAGVDQVDPVDQVNQVDDVAEGTPTDPEADAAVPEPPAGTLDDGTLLKPVAVDTTVADGKGLMRTYRVRSGDTLTGIARKFDVSMMTVWWANHLRAKDDLHIGQVLTIPPVSGVVVTVGAADTLEALAAKYRVEPSEIVDANDLDDPNLVIGQTLTIPGGLGAGIPTPKPKPKPVAKASTGGSTRSSSTPKPPARYSGGKFAWPVAGGYISQYFHYGHYAIDIAADRGTPVKAAAGGTVIFAGWKSNGGGYQVWISHGSNLYTTYNHMSSISVGRGQHVGRGQQVGRVGMTGNATGPHLHFEVWRGPVWNGGTRVNPLIYL